PRRLDQPDLLQPHRVGTVVTALLRVQRHARDTARVDDLAAETEEAWVQAVGVHGRQPGRRAAGHAAARLGQSRDPAPAVERRVGAVLDRAAGLLPRWPGRVRAHATPAEDRADPELVDAGHHHAVAACGRRLEGV